MLFRRSLAALAVLQFAMLPPVTGQEHVYGELQDRDAYAIYSIVALKVTGSSLARPARGFSIVQVTSADKPNNLPIAQCFPANYGTAFHAAFADYTSSNETPMLLTRSFHLPTPYELVTEEELARSFPKNGNLIDDWKKFYQVHPQSSGFLRFSVIGFNRDKTKAVVSVSFTCDWLCALDTDYLLQRTKSGWHVLSAPSQCGGMS